MNIYKYSIYKSVCDKCKMTGKDQTDKNIRSSQSKAHVKISEVLI